MKVLWLCNIIIPQIAKWLDTEFSNGGGWLDGLFEELKGETGLELAVVAPCYEAGQAISEKLEGVCFYSFYRILPNQRKCDDAVIKRFEEVIADFKPDIVHIFGTEYPHTLEMIKAFGQPSRTLIHIQGLVSICALHYLNGLSEHEKRAYSFGDFIRRENIKKQAEDFEARGMLEQEAIRNVGHVIGRTDWDKACTLQINSGIRYHYCAEALRDIFYTGCWNAAGCASHTIFISQGGYPVKGLHFMLDALAILKSEFPDVRLFIAGNDFVMGKTAVGKLKETYYAKLIRNRIKKNALEKHISFVGNLDAQGMKEEYLKANVSVLPSVIENSSNSLCEAMILGLPVVASYAGGTPSLLEHEKEGFLYPADAPYMLAYYIGEIFRNGELAGRLGSNARSRALERHNRSAIRHRTLEIYREILKKE